VILLVTWLAVRFKTKSIFLGILLVPCIVGSGLLYGEHTWKDRRRLLIHLSRTWSRTKVYRGTFDRILVRAPATPIRLKLSADHLYLA
jgi:hypothetical protein